MFIFLNLYQTFIHFTRKTVIFHVHGELHAFLEAFIYKRRIIMFDGNYIYVPPLFVA